MPGTRIKISEINFSFFATFQCGLFKAKGQEPRDDVFVVRPQRALFSKHVKGHTGFHSRYYLNPHLFGPFLFKILDPKTQKHFQKSKLHSPHTKHKIRQHQNGLFIIPPFLSKEVEPNPSPNILVKRDLQGMEIAQL